MPQKRDILDLAIVAVGDRGLNYGKPEDNFANIASLWTAYLQNRTREDKVLIHFYPTDVALMMALMKVARLQHSPGHLDSWVDLAGYAACGGEIAVLNPTLPEKTDG